MEARADCEAPQLTAGCTHKNVIAARDAAVGWLVTPPWRAAGALISYQAERLYRRIHPG